jgi:asparagine synthase (glutamine-hydrolysing)
LRLHGRLYPSTKYILRKAVRDLLGEEVLRQPKAGFGAPLDEWLRSDLREMVDDLLSEDHVRRAGYFAPESVAQLLREHRQGKHNWSMQIWQLLTLELWRQIFIEKRPAAFSEPAMQFPS